MPEKSCCTSLPVGFLAQKQAPGFENWNYTVENVDGALQVRHMGIDLDKKD